MEVLLNFAIIFAISLIHPFPRGQSHMLLSGWARVMVERTENVVNEEFLQIVQFSL